MVSLATALSVQHPEIDDPAEAIETGRVLVGGKPVLNPRARVADSVPITVEPELVLRGAAKLEAAITDFDVPVDGRIALDCGAAAGGFTSVLLAHGAARVYAVDAGHGQLRGELRQNPRVVNLERTNLGELTTDLVPDVLGLVTFDLSYLSIARALPELDRVQLAPDAELVAPGEAHVRARARRALPKTASSSRPRWTRLAAASRTRRGRCSAFRSRRPAAGVEQSSSCSTLDADRASLRSGSGGVPDVVGRRCVVDVVRSLPPPLPW